MEEYLAQLHTAIAKLDSVEAGLGALKRALPSLDQRAGRVIFADRLEELEVDLNDLLRIANHQSYWFTKQRRERVQQCRLAGD